MSSNQQSKLPLPEIPPEQLIDDDWTYQELQDRHWYLGASLESLALPAAGTAAAVESSSNKSNKSRGRRSTTTTATTTTTTDTDTTALVVPRVDKTADTHRDFLLKEMQWLATDFTAERARHKQLRRKVVTSLHQHWSRLQITQQNLLNKSHQKQQQTAHKVSTKIKHWWKNLDKVVTFVQKQEADQAAQKAMNQQLVVLVQQTEQYTQSLGSGGGGGIDNNNTSSIEQALALASSSRRNKPPIDYKKMKAPAPEELYGESTDDASGSDASFVLDEDEDYEDDETTLQQAEQEEIAQRQQQQQQQQQQQATTESMDTTSCSSFVADPVELQQLQEEARLPVETVLRQWRQQQHDDGHEADDDGDASDVEDYVQQLTTTTLLEDDEDMQEQDEFEPLEENDDETTLIAEEKLGRDISYQQEIDLLKRESEMSVEELRKMYSGAIEETNDDDNDREEPNVEPEPKDYYSLVGVQNNASDEGEEEFQPDDAVVDDETTMEAEEKLGRDMTYKEEIDLLKRESEMSVEELRKMYANMDDADEEESDTVMDEESSVRQLLVQQDEADAEDQEEFKPTVGDAVDDETTMEAEEKLGRDMTYKEEIDLLKRESEMSVEELRKMYAGMDDEKASPEASGTDYESAVEDESEMPVDGEGGKASGDTGLSLRRSRRKRGRDPLTDGRDTKQARLESDSESQPSDAGKKAMDALEASAVLARSTRATRPFLLAPWVKLREYQQIGLNWLVSMQTRRLNGILADEMGLGKTLQTISLLSYLASYKGIWGPHLVVVPTSVILNWETELKRFCPAFKVLTYYGSAKRRKELRTGWTKSNWYHVVITSYQLAVQDAFAFKRKRWYYLICDEAQNIKNFQSQRWQTLINFNTQRRLLLTGTPLQNSLMELWSLLHFLMPYIFRSRKEFSYWFANPMNSMIEGTSVQNDSVVSRLHGIIRPFVLRRLKKDVETQMPGKFEHIIKCQLSRRQMFIYEEFMARSSTRQALRKGGNFMGMMNVLMQLRKVCNHPDLFEPRSVITPFALDGIVLPVPPCVMNISSKASPFHYISASLLTPLWSGSDGQPSTYAALKHDSIESAQLRLLENPLPLNTEEEDGSTMDLDDLPPSIRGLNSALLSKRKADLISHRTFVNVINSRRCKAPEFSYPERLLESTRVKGASSKLWQFDEISTPAHLLAMRRDQQERADDVDQLIRKFVFCVPKAGGQRPSLAVNDTRGLSSKPLDDVLLEPLEECLRPFQKARARLTSFFPDKKLVQFDAGKLQTLAELLRELKRGGHRCLIFTQMSKMLDILEAFLNLNGHKYVRLDGSTGVDQRQRLMDRFNNDDKLFCFILSTRSGGMGINLTGADTVIFYDNDWNPAMDAQAQDRAHRIGQTREVHIFRLVTESTIEENILSKAQQKRNLDILVMDRGNFDAKRLFSQDKEAKAREQTNAVKDVYTKGGLRAILGVEAEQEVEEDKSGEDDTEDEARDPGKMETAMASLEDVDDVNALRGAQKEAADELKEFDESVEYAKESDAEDVSDAPTGRKGTGKKDQDSKSTDTEDDKVNEKEMEKEFAAWQDKVGVDASAIETSLSPMERYGLRFRTDVDPFYSVYAIETERRKMEAQEEADGMIDIDEIEREKAEEELRAMEDGDLLATFPEPEDLIRQRNLYTREKSRLRANKKLRKLTGQDWESRIDGHTQNPFWYNIDTSEAVWDKPDVLLNLEAYKLAEEKRWISMPTSPLVHIMSYLVPFPDRMNCARMCRQWRKAASDISFVLHVYPVEMGAYTRDEKKMLPNHFCELSDALKASNPGDTIELGDGHYWANEDLVVDKPLSFVGDEHNPSNVVIEMGGSFIWKALGGFCEGITFRRPKLSSGDHLQKEILCLEPGSRVHIIESVLDNEGSNGDVVLSKGGKGTWRNVVVRNGAHGLSLKENSQFQLTECSIRKNQSDGILCHGGSSIALQKCVLQENADTAIVLMGQSKGILKRCHFDRSPAVLRKETGSHTSCSENTCTKGSLKSLPPGFKFVDPP